MVYLASTDMTIMSILTTMYIPFAMMPCEMTSRFVVPSIPVAEAKKSLPTYLDRARDHVLQIVTRHKRDEVALLDLQDLRELLRGHKFQTDVAVHRGEASVNLPQFRIIGIGENVADATEDALAKLREYALQYLERFEFYKHTDRRDLYPLVMRFLATPEDEQLELLFEPETVEAEPALA